MPELLLELFSEEIPARMQAQAASDLQKLVTNALVEAGLTYEGAASFATPRRLALHVAGLPASQPDTREERKGPRVGAPDKAVRGFVKSAGLTSIDEAQVVSDPKGKGEFYSVIIERKGVAAIDVLAEVLPKIIRGFPWPKSMRWGEASVSTEALRWVRPLHSILCTFGPDTEEPDIVPFEVGGINSGNVTYGHRFMSPEVIIVRRFDDYVPALEKAKVVLDPARRRDIISHDARNLAHAQGLELIEDDGLLHEVAGLVEWPVVLMGEFEKEFLAIPPEVIRATIRANQKCFVLRDPTSSGETLSNKFLLVSNIEATDGGKEIAAGNARVVRARLSDALYFWQTDQADLPDFVNDDNRGKPLDQRMAKLRALNIVFHEKLGTQADRVERIKALARELAPIVGADADKAERAAELCKADLVTEVVGEFPETQGLMGRYYAQFQGEDDNVCIALEDHYKPQGPSDRIPDNPVAIAVALADKLDTLVGFWAIDEKPTGSKDPYALRRAALGVIRIVLENGICFNLTDLLFHSYSALLSQFGDRFNLFENDGSDDDEPDFYQVIACGLTENQVFDPCEQYLVLFGEARNYHNGDDEIFLINGQDGDGWGNPTFVPTGSGLANDLLSFFHDRLKIYLRDQGARHDLIDAALGAANTTPHAEGAPKERVSKHGGKVTSFETQASPVPQDEVGGGADSPTPGPSPQGGGEISGNDDLLIIVRRVEALGKFLDTDDGKNLLAGYKRAANILRAEEKKEKDASGFDEDYQPQADVPEAEQALAAAIRSAAAEAAKSVTEEKFEAAMTALAKLRAPVDRFFEDVTVNDPDPEKRLNRLRLLNALRDAVHKVADFAKISG